MKKYKKPIHQLTDLPNVGKSIAGDFNKIGVMKPEDLKGRDPILLYENLCRVTGKKHDPCVLDVFMSVKNYLDSGKELPWWKFTKERKILLNKRQKE